MSIEMRIDYTKCCRADTATHSNTAFVALFFKKRFVK